MIGTPSYRSAASASTFSSASSTRDRLRASTGCAAYHVVSASVHYAGPARTRTHTHAHARTHAQADRQQRRCHLPRRLSFTRRGRTGRALRQFCCSLNGMDVERPAPGLCELGHHWLRQHFRQRCSHLRLRWGPRLRHHLGGRRGRGRRCLRGLAHGSLGIRLAFGKRRGHRTALAAPFARADGQRGCQLLRRLCVCLCQHLPLHACTCVCMCVHACANAQTFARQGHQRMVRPARGPRMHARMHARDAA